MNYTNDIYIIYIIHINSYCFPFNSQTSYEILIEKWRIFSTNQKDDYSTSRIDDYSRAIWNSPDVRFTFFPRYCK